MKSMMVFRATAVDANSVVAHDAGTAVDMGAFLVEDLKSIMAGNGFIELTFNETGKFNAGSGFGGVTNDTADDADQAILGQALENTIVKLSCVAADIPALIMAIPRVLNSTSPLYNDGMFLFDAVGGVYPTGIKSVTAILIKRTTTTVATTVA
jgi:hypothetical protein